jgi:hypothetical protein
MKNKFPVNYNREFSAVFLVCIGFYEFCNPRNPTIKTTADCAVRVKMSENAKFPCRFPVKQGNKQNFTNISLFGTDIQSLLQYGNLANRIPTHQNISGF